MKISRNVQFSLLVVGALLFSLLLIAEFLFNIGIISDHSITALFVTLFISLLTWYGFTLGYVKRFNDERGKMLLGYMMVPSLVALFFLVINLLVMF